MHRSIVHHSFDLYLIPFDLFRVKMLNSYIFYELYECEGIGTQVRK